MSHMDGIGPNNPLEDDYLRGYKDGEATAKHEALLYLNALEDREGLDADGVISRMRAYLAAK